MDEDNNENKHANFQQRFPYIFTWAFLNIFFYLVELMPEILLLKFINAKVGCQKIYEVK